MVRLARNLIEDRDDDDRLQQAMQLRNNGEPERALEVIDAIVVKAAEPPVVSAGEPADFEQDPVDERRMQAELRYLAGDRERAHEAFQQLHTADPEDEEVMEWLELTRPTAQVVAESTEPASESAAESTPLHAERESDPDQDVGQAPVEHGRDRDPPVQPASEEGGLQQQLFCDDLFGDSTRSFDVNKRFEQEYVARQVRWQGELLKVERNYSAFIFEESTGAKATFKIDERKSPYFGTDNVLAVVHLPESAIEELKNRVGEQLRFSGKLVKVDGLMRNVYLDHGAVD
jgi:hypothetical protein